MFRIEFTPEALEDIRQFRKSEQRRVVKGIENQLAIQPTKETRNRKKLRPNRLAEWELRVDKFRIFYDLHEAGRVVKIEAVGYKSGSRLFIHGKEFSL